MERYELTAQRAFEYLLRASSLSNTKVRDLAVELVEAGGGRGSAHADPATPGS
jgi:hypothetical protein